MSENELREALAAQQSRLDQLEAQLRETRRSRARRAPLLGAALIVVLAGLALAVPPTVPGVPNTMVADAPALAAAVNANFANLAARSVPSGTVVFFNGPECPVGWTELTAARGRFLVGAPQGGTIGSTATVGTALSNLESRTAGYATSGAGAHRHRWAHFDGAGLNDWYTYDDMGAYVVTTDWTDGMDSAGVGNYPLSNTDGAYRDYYTETTGSHSHSVTVSSRDLAPYLQLLVCQKS